MEAKIIDGVLCLKAETQEESVDLHDWFMRFQIPGTCEACVNIPYEFMDSKIMEGEVH